MCRRSKKSVVVNVKVIWSWEKGNFFLLWCDVALIWCYLIPALRRVDGRMTENSRSWNTVQTPSEFTVNLANGSEKWRERDVEAARKRAGSGRRVVRKYREILPLDSASTILRPTYPFLPRPPLCLPSCPSLKNPGTRS